MSLADIKDITIALAAVFAAGSTFYAAVFGIKSWRKKLEWEAIFSREKLKWKVNFNTGRKLFESAYLLHKNIGHCRYSSFEESHEDEYPNRLESLNIALHAFDSEARKTEVLFWGRPIQEKIKQLRDCAIKLKAYMECFIGNKYSLDFGADKDFSKEVRETIWISGPENKFTIRVDNAIKEIKSEIKSQIEGNQIWNQVSDRGKYKIV